MLCTISIHALLAESDKLWDAPDMPTQEISIHALLAESDKVVRSLPVGFEISIHALLAESDRKNELNRNGSRLFLSTLSLRRATLENGLN